LTLVSLASSLPRSLCLPPSALLALVHSCANMQADGFALARDQALAQVSEVQERNLRVIQGLMDDLAKADVVRAGSEGRAREQQGRGKGGAQRVERAHLRVLVCGLCANAMMMT
jgi:hypothetical protein